MGDGDGDRRVTKSDSGLGCVTVFGCVVDDIWVLLFVGVVALRSEMGSDLDLGSGTRFL